MATQATSTADSHWLLPVTGLTCAGCVSRLQKSLEAHPCVKKANVNLALETLDIAISDVASSQQLLAWVEDAGFGLQKQHYRYHLSNVSCAGCVRKIESKVVSLSGVISANVNLALSELSVTALEGAYSDKQLRAELTSLNFPADSDLRNNSESAVAGSDQDIRLVFLAAALTLPLVLSMAASWLGFNWMLPGWMQLLLASPVQFWLGFRFYKGAWSALRQRSANMDVLVALGTTAAFFYSVFLWFWMQSDQLYFEASAVVITLILLGKLLESRAKRHASEAIRSLLRLQPKTAMVWTDDKLISVPVEQLKPGDLVQIQPGSIISADGTVISGESELNESMLTGESRLVHKTIADRVMAGTQNYNGSLTIKIDANASDFRIQQIVKLIEGAQAGKPAIQHLVDQIAAVFVPVVLGVALLTLGVQWSLNGFEYALMASISVLVIACPCALGLATPTAIITASGVGAKHGLLIREIDQLEALATTNTIVFDKTGTLTQGNPRVACEQFWLDSNSAPDASQRLQNTIYSLQLRSQHPLAKELVRHLGDRFKDTPLVPLPVTDFTNQSGLGVTAVVDGNAYAMGNSKMMERLGVNMAAGFSDACLSDVNKATTCVWVAKSRLAAGQSETKRFGQQEYQLVARFDFIDPLQDAANALINKLQRLDNKVCMFTGDNEQVAASVAKELGVDHFLANMSPEHKQQALERLQQKGPVVMVGDGINDAPALAAADVGIALGNGTDIAIEAAGITLLRPDISLVLTAVALAKATRSKIRQNLFWAFFYNLVGIPLAACGWLTPVIAGAAMAFSSVSVVTSSLWLKKWRAPVLSDGSTAGITCEGRNCQ